MQTAEHKGGKKGKAIRLTAHVGTHAQMCTSKQCDNKKVSLCKMDLIKSWSASDFTILIVH